MAFPRCCFDLTPLLALLSFPALPSLLDEPSSKKLVITMVHDEFKQESEREMDICMYSFSNNYKQEQGIEVGL
jgi:hypothetical protein